MGILQKEKVEWLMCVWKRCLVILVSKGMPVKMRDTTLYLSGWLNELESQIMTGTK